MTIANMPVLPSTTSTTAGECPICGDDVPENGMHICFGTKVIDRLHLQQPVPLSLAELKRISSILDTMKETLRQINHKSRRG